MSTDDSTLSPELPLDYEEWRAVVGYEGAYEVSSLGRVRSLDRYLADGRRRHGRPKSLAIHQGYPAVTLFKNREPKTIKIHALVAAAFIGPRPEGHQVNHKGNNVVDSPKLLNT